MKTKPLLHHLWGAERYAGTESGGFGEGEEVWVDFENQEVLLRRPDGKWFVCTTFKSTADAKTLETARKQCTKELREASLEATTKGHDAINKLLFMANGSDQRVKAAKLKKTK